MPVKEPEVLTEYEDNLSDEEDPDYVSYVEQVKIMEAYAKS